MQADIKKGFVKVERCENRILVVSVPNGWDDCKKLVNKVLEFCGEKYAWTGWNSDRNEAFFKLTENFARIL